MGYFCYCQSQVSMCQDLSIRKTTQTSAAGIQHPVSNTSLWQHQPLATLCLSLALPLQLRIPKKADLMKAIAGSTRSSTFLATFITLFYYGVLISSNLTRHKDSKVADLIQRHREIHRRLLVSVERFLHL
jgi:hypothetical protein